MLLEGACMKEGYDGCLSPEWEVKRLVIWTQESKGGGKGGI